MASTLRASPETCAWGFFDASQPAVLEVQSGDVLTIETVSGGPDQIPQQGAGFEIPPELLDIHARAERQLPGHILTGPVAVKGAKPGDVLEVEILDVELPQNWGWNTIRPLAGTLPDDFPDARLEIIPLDLDSMQARLSWGLDLPLHPFFGVMGVAPPPNWGRISTIQPRAHGGNLDNKELGAGATLYLPVFAEGAMFSCGDGHAAQGDGEVCVTAIETALTGTFRLTVHSDFTLKCPRAKTRTHLITMGMHEDLDRCVEMALRDMIRWIVQRTGISREDAYMLCSLAGDLRITQTVNGNKGVHMMMRSELVPCPDVSAGGTLDDA
ncbi:MAG: acetamidase/formamidase family protein [Paracoccaceae bacterium]